MSTRKILTKEQKIAEEARRFNFLNEYDPAKGGIYENVVENTSIRDPQPELNK